MQVNFYNELIECSKYRFGDGFGKTTLQDFKKRIFTKKYLLESFIILRRNPGLAQIYLLFVMKY